MSFSHEGKAQTAPVDVIYLKDGQRLKGQIVSEGATIVLDTLQGRVTIAADNVRFIDRASASTPAPPPELGVDRPAALSATPAVPKRMGPTRIPTSVYELRLEGSYLFKNYDLPTQDLGERGGGGGLGASAILTHNFVKAALPPTWAGLHLGASASFHYIAYSEDGIPKGQSAKLTKGAQNADVTMFDFEPSAFAGFHVGLGSISDDSVWRGVILGASIAPTLVVFFPGAQVGGAQVNPVGIRATFDFGSFDPYEPRTQHLFHAYFTWLPFVNSLPSMGSAGLGVSFY